MSWDSDIVCHTCKVRKTFACHSGGRAASIKPLDDFYDEHVYPNHHVSIMNFDDDKAEICMILETYKDLDEEVNVNVGSIEADE